MNIKTPLNMNSGIVLLCQQPDIHPRTRQFVKAMAWGLSKFIYSFFEYFLVNF